MTSLATSLVGAGRPLACLRRQRSATGVRRDERGDRRRRGLVRVSYCTCSRCAAASTAARRPRLVEPPLISVAICRQLVWPLLDFPVAASEAALQESAVSWPVPAP